MDKEGDNIRKLMATPPHPEHAGREPPSAEQLLALEKHLLELGFAPSVAHEQKMTAQLFGMDKAIEALGRMRQSFPANDGVPGTAARSSREAYFEDLTATKWPYPGMPKYPERLKKIPQTGTSKSYRQNSYKYGDRSGP